MPQCWFWDWLRARTARIAPGAHLPETLPATSCTPCSTKPDSPISQPRTACGDGLVLTNLYITAAARCAPPDNKPLPQELANCAPYLARELEGLKNLRVIVALGRIGFDSYLGYLKRRGAIASKAPYAFGHGACYTMPNGITLLASYHPSNQNTNTGKLTRAMFSKFFNRAQDLTQRFDQTELG